MTGYLVTYPMSLENLPTVGGSAFDMERLRMAVSAVRLRPPSLDPHLFRRELKEGPDRARGRNENGPPEWTPVENTATNEKTARQGAAMWAAWRIAPIPFSPAQFAAET